MLRNSAIVLAVSALVLACGHPPRSAWEQGGQYHVCTCHGTTRAPTPSEASNFADDESVDLYCEGKVDKCHIGQKNGGRYHGMPRLNDND
jgi:hypothetical protein